MGVAVATAAAMLAAVPVAAAESADQPDGAISSGTVGAAPSDQSFLVLDAPGLLWALAGLLAVVVGLVLATRRVRKPISDLAPTSGPGGSPAGRSTAARPRSTANTNQIISDNEPGGARK